MSKHPLAIVPIIILWTLIVLLPNHTLAKKPFVSNAGRFSAIFPTPPQASQQKEKTAVGAIGINIYKSQSKKGVFTVEYSILPEVAIFFGGKHTIYDKAKDEFLKKTGATEISFAKTEVAGHPARELKFTTGSGKSGRAQFILVGHHFYTLVAESGNNPKALNTFLNSFQILP